MVHAELVAPKVEFSYEGVFDFNELMSVIKGFLKRYDYFFIEKRNYTKTKNGLKTTNLRYSIEKELDDYTKAFVDFRINLTDYKESYVDGKKVVDGNIQVLAIGIINRDYEEEWKKTPTKKFFRALYDKYVVAPKLKKVDGAFINMINDLMKEIKTYFKA